MAGKKIRRTFNDICEEDEHLPLQMQLWEVCFHCSLAHIFLSVFQFNTSLKLLNSR